MNVELKSLAEKEARKAEELEAFSGLNLLHVKRAVAELLAMIGGQGIFDEYTKHDISHIDSMLDLLESLILPTSTAKKMSSADWLMTVLAIYFHDLGMLVTKAEYRRRAESGYPKYRDEVLLTSDDKGRDYAAKIQG